MKTKVLITSALLYANGPLHFGHIAGAYLPADCYARFRRLLGDDVLFISGSDEYGVAITLSAELAGRTAKEHVDIFHKLNQDLFKKIDISFDHYSRTTWKGHDKTTIEFFEDLKANGHIEEKVEEHLYSEQEDRFLADRYVVGTCPECGFDEARGDECQKCGASYEATQLKSPRSKLSKKPLVKKPSKHWYLRFDHFKDQLAKWIEKKSWKENVVNFAMRYIKDLHPRAITRDSKWGIPLPLKDTEGKVFYVWFDAPIGYISAAKEWSEKTGKPDRWKDFWLDQSTEYSCFIGKDNIPFHSVFFPAMIMGQNQKYKLPDHLPANEFLMYEGKQFSKSDGWTIDLEDFFKKFSSDQIRYFLAANAPENSDSEFTWKDFQVRCNAELLGKLGNFVNRVLTFAHQQCEAIVPEPKDLTDIDQHFLHELSLKVLQIQQHYQNYQLRKACHGIMEVAQMANGYFDAQKPWKAAKEDSLRQMMNNTIYCCIQCLKNLALISYPVIPDAANKIWSFLGNSTGLEKALWEEVRKESVDPGQKLQKPSILFKKVEDEQIFEEVEKLGKAQESSATHNFEPLKDPIQFDHFMQLDLRIAEILYATRIEKSKKLLKLEVDLGFEKRFIVSGVAHAFSPEDLIGKKVIVLANLEPRKIMGVQSQGMVLAASFEKFLELPEIQNLKPGSIVS